MTAILNVADTKYRNIKARYSSMIAYGENIQVLFENLGAYILVFCRMGSMLFFNPLLARKNVVSSVKSALALGLTLIITPTLNVSQIEAFEGLVFLFAMLKEFLVGFAAGLVFQIFYYMLFHCHHLKFVNSS